MNPNRYLRTTSFRLVAVYTGAFAASVVVLFALVYWITSSALTEQLKTSINAEIEALVTGFDGKNLSDLAGDINKRHALGSRSSLFHLLQDSSGRKVAGNFGVMRPFLGWRELPAPEGFATQTRQDPRDESEHMVLARGRVLPGGAFLLVGVNRYNVYETEEAIIRAFSWGAGAALLLAIIGGLVTSVGFLRRVDVINRTSREIVAGNLSDRVPLRGTNDEMDRLAENINDMLDRIQVLLEGLRQVTNDIAHDLRTPLSRLKQRLEATRRSARTIDEYERAVERALADADTALATFGALLRIAQIESRSRRSSFAEINLSRIVEDVVATYLPVAEDLGKTIHSDIQPTITISGDRDLLVQMFVNLLENALRHTSKHAKISVSLSTDTGSPVAVIADNGSGIPKVERNRVFQRFYRLDQSRSTPGSGLGLALVAAVAGLHQIRIQLEGNRPGLRVALTFAETL